MAFATFTQSFGSSYANGTVVIRDSATGAPATILATTTGGLLNNLGQATLDASGNLSVIIDTAITWTVNAFDGNATNKVEPLTYAETAQTRTALLTGRLGTVNAQTGTAYTLALTDAGDEVTMTNASPNTLTIPLNATVSFPIPTVIDVIMNGAGTTTVAATGGVTIVKPTALALAIAGQYQGIRLTKVGVDLWRANGI